MRAGRPVEDDRIEVKSEWPASKAARQMAGAANALRGEPLIYIIGCRENGTLSDPGDQDPESWYRAICGEFNSAPPRLLLHVTVTVGDSPGDTVSALAFGTDEFPYVMMVRGVSDRREVPIRTATGTSSADRQHLLRILAPTLSMPRCEVVAANLRAQFNEYPASESDVFIPARRSRKDLTLVANAQVYVERMGQAPVSLPTRLVRGRLLVPGREPLALSAEVGASSGTRGVVRNAVAVTANEPTPPTYGVWVARGYMVATGPGDFSVRARGSLADHGEGGESALVALMTEMDHASEVVLELRLTFVGSERHTYLRAPLQVVAPKPLIGATTWERRWSHDEDAEDGLESW